MNKFSYDELFVGQTAEFTRTITADMVEKFREISGDGNPLHVDDNFAREKGFPARVVYGMLTASLYSCFAGEYISGERCLLHSVHADFLNPVFIGDTLTVTGKIVEKHDSVKQIVMKVLIRNQDGKKISRAKIEAGGGLEKWKKLTYCLGHPPTYACHFCGVTIGNPTIKLSRNIFIIPRS